MDRKKYFSLEEANNVLPEVKMLLKELVKMHIRLRINDGILINYDDEFENTFEEVEKSYRTHQLHSDFFRLIKELMDKGVFVKDPSTGLIDFYSRFNNEEIFLCYQYPEDKIEYWHGIEEGYDDRKHIKLLDKKQDF